MSIARRQIRCLAVPALLLLCVCLTPSGAYGDVIVHSVQWGVSSSGDSYSRETSWDSWDNPTVSIVDAPGWNSSAQAFNVDGSVHSVSGSSDSSLSGAAGSASQQSWIDGGELHAAGAVEGSAFGGSGSTGWYSVDAWGETSCLASFETVFELTEAQEIDISGFLTATYNGYDYADTHLIFSNSAGSTLFDLYANPTVSTNEIAFSQLLAADSYTLLLAAAYSTSSSFPPFSASGSYNVTVDFGTLSSSNPSPVPEPGTVTLLGMGILAIAMKKRAARH